MVKKKKINKDDNVSETLKDNDTADENNKLTPSEMSRIYIPVNENGAMRPADPGGYIVNQNHQVFLFDLSAEKKEMADFVIHTHKKIQETHEDTKSKILQTQEEEFIENYPGLDHYISSLKTELEHAQKVDETVQCDPTVSNERKNIISVFAKSIARQLNNARRMHYEQIFQHNKDKKNTKLIFFGSIAAVVLLAEKTSFMHYILSSAWSLLQILFLFLGGL